MYKSVFGIGMDDKIVGGGFAYKNGEWKFNSFSFSNTTKYHDDQKSVNVIEQQLKIRNEEFKLHVGYCCRI